MANYIINTIKTGTKAALAAGALYLSSCIPAPKTHIVDARPELNQDQLEQILFTRPVSVEAAVGKSLDAKVQQTVLRAEYVDHSLTGERYKNAVAAFAAVKGEKTKKLALGRPTVFNIHTKKEVEGNAQKEQYTVQQALEYTLSAEQIAEVRKLQDADYKFVVRITDSDGNSTEFVPVSKVSLPAVKHPKEKAEEVKKEDEPKAAASGTAPVNPVSAAYGHPEKAAKE